MSTLTVVRATINIGDIELEAYTANEISSTTGRFINYLSGSVLAASIDLEPSTTLQKRLSKELKTRLGNNFTTLQGRYLNNSGAYTKLNLWDTVSSAHYYSYHAMQGNQKALAIIIALASTTLDIIIDDKFGRQYRQGSAEQWIKHRLKALETRKNLTGVIKEWYKNNPGKTSCPDFAMYPRVTDAIYKALWGKTAKQLEEILECDRHESRNFMDEKSLALLERAESLVMEYIEYDNIKPFDAVALANIRFRNSLPQRKED